MHRSPRRAGQTNAAWLAFLGSIVLFVLLGAYLLWDPSRSDLDSKGGSLLVYCAAGLKVPVEKTAQDYEKEYGVRVQLQYGGSETLLTNLALSRRGDLYIPADTSYLEQARGKSLIDETLEIGQMSPVIAVQKGNPRKIATLDDLLRPEVRLAQANPDAAAIGKLTRATLEKSKQWEAVKQHTHVFKGTVTDVANDVKVGTVDAGIVWDVTVRQYPELEAVVIPQLRGVRSQIALGVLRSTAQPSAALRFARYLTARDRGLKQFTQAGFPVIEGDAWAEKPQLHLLAGSMLRPALQDTLRAFEAREGIPPIKTIYNGCGILVAQMKAGEHPDAYFACDRSFMTQVHDLFLDENVISSNQLVILVLKGNPHKIRSLQDLAKPGLRVGVGHEQQCAMGALTQETLKQSGLQDRVMDNVKVRVPTGDMLVNQLRVRSLDAVIAYISNGTVAADELEAIRIDIPCAVAQQPFAIGKESQHRHLTERLLTAIRSRESRERFESAGFKWKAQ